MEQVNQMQWKSVSMVQSSPHSRVIIMAPVEWPTEQEVQDHIDAISRIAYLDQLAHATREARR